MTDAVDDRRLSVPATSEGIRSALDAIEELARDHGLSKAVTWPVAVALDEVLANVVAHARPDASAPVEVLLRLELGPEAPLCEVLVADEGPAFDPLSAAAPDTALSLEERPIGGLGIALVRRLMDELHYERRDGRNCLRMRRRLVDMAG